MHTNVEISRLKTEEVQSYIDLVREVYDEFVAPGYPEEGNHTFCQFITRDAELERIHDGNLVICAKTGGAIIGVHEVRDYNHIALFFIKKEYQNRGIGKMLFDYSLNQIKIMYPEICKLTVNSSPYAVNIYKRLGFTGDSVIHETDGIKYYPMVYRIY